MLLPLTMQAARCLDYGRPIQIVTVPVPTIKDSELLVKISAAALCHTDVGVIKGDKQVENSICPITIGHEPIGHVVKVGSMVKGFAVGDRVGFVNHAGACGVCDECQAGRNVYCLDTRTKARGISLDGCFAEYSVADALFSFHIPESLPDEAAAPLMCAGITSFAGLQSLCLSPGDWIAIVGFGGLGHVLIQFAKAKGYHVMAVDLRPTALELATSLGADLVIRADLPDDVAKANAVTNGGVHGSIVLAESNRACKLAANTTRKHGTVCLIAAPPEDWQVDPLHVIHKDLKFTGSLLGNPEQCREMLAFADEHKIYAHTKTYPFSEVTQMLDDFELGETNGRLVVLFE